jgi:hypothetical protein
MMNWENEAILLLDELVQPIPLFVRPLAKRSIKKQVEAIASKEKVDMIRKKHVIHGYIMAAPKKDTSRIKRFLAEKGIDYKPYEHLLNS